jgi:short-subunit dehydrogenase
MNASLSHRDRKRARGLRGRVVVITGASSGIGRAAARAFAREGARLTLAARHRDTLEEVAAECIAEGAEVLVVPVDVSEEIPMFRLARATDDAYGGIDIWINNAGIGLFGPFAEADMEAHRRVVETNLFGTMNGATAVLPIFLRQRRGVLITNISLGGFAPVPFASAYTASKFGLRGFMAALRQELAHEPGIHVCSIFPSMIDTPGFQHGGNVSGVALRPAPPVYPPEKVAAALVDLALHPRDEVSVGLPSRVARISYGMMPGLTERMIGGVFRRYLKKANPEPRRRGNLFGPSKAPLTPEGGWRRRPRAASAATTLACVGFGGVTAIALLRILQAGERQR